jgi:hypothetical protein
MAPAPKTPSLLPELRTLAQNIKDLPYDQLLPAAAEAGWLTQLQQVDATGQTDGTVLVTFQVFVGKEDRFEPYDLLSVKVAPGPGPVSAVARRIAVDSLVPLFFGRYPQVAAPAQPAAQTIRTDDVDIVLPGEPRGDQEYVNDDIAPPIKVVDHFEPDGVPIFVDLYALGDPSGEVIQYVMDEVENFLERAQSVETINAMGTKNPMMIKFIKDLGTPEDSAAFMDMVSRRRNLVAPPVLSNARRRSAAAAN